MMIPKFDPENKLIIIPRSELRNDGSIVINPRRDIYSRWVDWLYSNLQYDGKSVVCRGGGLLPDGSRQDSVTIVKSGYKIVCPDGCLKVIIEEGIMAEDGTSPFISDQSKVLVERHIKNKAFVSPLTYFATWILTMLGLGIGIAWILSNPKDYEPYSVVVLGVLAIIGNSRMKYIPNKSVFTTP